MSVMRLIRMGERRAFPLALMAIGTVAAAAGCGPSGSKPAAQATPKQPTASQAVATTQSVASPQKFTSQEYGFRVTLAKGWSEHDALVAWNGKKLQGLDSGAFANFADPVTGRALAAAAAPVAQGMGLAEWRAAMVRGASSSCSESSSVEQTTLAGEPALAWTARCSDGYNVAKLATVRGKRGFMILLASPTAKRKTQDRLIFESIRRSFRFTR